MTLSRKMTKVFKKSGQAGAEVSHENKHRSIKVISTSQLNVLASADK